VRRGCVKGRAGAGRGGGELSGREWNREPNAAAGPTHSTRYRRRSDTQPAGLPDQAYRGWASRGRVPAGAAVRCCLRQQRQGIPDPEPASRPLRSTPAPSSLGQRLDLAQVVLVVLGEDGGELLDGQLAALRVESRALPGGGGQRAQQRDQVLAAPPVLLEHRRRFRV